MIEYIIGRNSASLRADRFLLKATTAPSSLIYKAFRKKDVKINGKWIKGPGIDFFDTVKEIVPTDIPLTSFSILFARYKGALASQVKAAKALASVTDSSRILISEGCTHHRSCGDIGTVKLPAAIRRFSGKNPLFSFTQGGDFPTDLSAYDLVIHCGGCMLNQPEMTARMARCAAAGIPMVNYGVAIAHMHGILRRSLAVFPSALAELDR